MLQEMLARRAGGKGEPAGMQASNNKVVLPLVPAFPDSNSKNVDKNGFAENYETHQAEAVEQDQSVEEVEKLHDDTQGEIQEES